MTLQRCWQLLEDDSYVLKPSVDLAALDSADAIRMAEEQPQELARCLKMFLKHEQARLASWERTLGAKWVAWVLASACVRRWPGLPGTQALPVMLCYAGPRRGRRARLQAPRPPGRRPLRRRLRRTCTILGSSAGTCCSACSAWKRRWPRRSGEKLAALGAVRGAAGWIEREIEPQAA